MEIQKLMKVHLCYITCDNSQVTLRNVVVVHKYCDFHYWWTAVAWYLTDQVKSDRVLKNLTTHALCYVKSWMAVDEPRTAVLD